VSKTKGNFFITLKDSWILVVILSVASLFISFLIVKVNVIISPIIIFLIIGLLATGLIFKNYIWGFYGGLILTCIMFYLERILPFGIPYGVLCDLLFLLAFISLLFDPRQKDWRQYTTDPITIGYFIIFVYQILQVFNPNAVSLSGWLFSIRTLVFPLIMLTSFGIIGRLSGIKTLLKVWFLIASIAALYGIYQEFFDLTGFEWKWVNDEPSRYKAYFVVGHMRKFSFLSDPAAFGGFMAYSALAAFCLLFAPLSTAKKFALGFSFIIMVVSMLYSGTRTAYAMVAIGIIFFILITIRKKANFVIAFILVIGMLTIIFGPFYGRQANRLRSAFLPSNDASMEVRDVKRTQLQPYILSHPVGGGLNTTGSAGVKYSAGHHLAGGWDADSGYLKVALEQGWIGLSLLMVFLFMVMVKGIDNYFKLHDPMLQSINLTFIIPFFAVTVGTFTQSAIWYKPLFIFVIVTYSVVVSIKKLDDIKSMHL
jgi:putative inorganic carbon (hco3(-)) transporter